MTKLEHIYAIKNILYSGPVTDDARYSNKLIAHFLKLVRARLLKQKLNKYQALSEVNYQTLCMPLVKADLSECSSCLNLPSSCVLLRSKYKIPKVITDRWGDVIKVRKFNGFEIGFLPLSSLRYYEYSESNDPFFFIFNEYLFIVGEPLLKAVMITGLFEEPEELNNYNICDSSGEEEDDPCYNSAEDNYPLDTDLATVVYQLVIKNISPYAFIPDHQNDARDNTSAMAQDRKDSGK